MSKGNELGQREVITSSVHWHEYSFLPSSGSKTNKIVVDSSNKLPWTTSINIQGLDIEIMGEPKYLGVHISNKPDQTTNTDDLYQKGQSFQQLLSEQHTERTSWFLGAVRSSSVFDFRMSRKKQAVLSFH